MSDKQVGALPSDRATHERSPTVSAVPVGIPSAVERRLKSLAADHYRNARRLAHRLTLAEDELRRMKKERSL